MANADAITVAITVVAITVVVVGASLQLTSFFGCTANLRRFHRRRFYLAGNCFLFVVRIGFKSRLQARLRGQMVWRRIANFHYATIHIYKHKHTHLYHTHICICLYS